MIKSLFRQMWNQRHANVWVWVELIVVLILLWYSIDLVYNYEVAARQSKGYDTENVFDIQLNIKPALQNDSVLMSHSAEYLEQIYHLIQQYQGVEEACFYYGTIPYTGNNMYEGICSAFGFDPCGRLFHPLCQPYLFQGISFAAIIRLI